MRALFLVAALTACESSPAWPAPYIVRVTPSSWDLSQPADSMLVVGREFLRAARTDVSSDTDPSTTRSFKGTLGGRELPRVSWLTNELLELVPPPDLGPGFHTLEITTPLGHQAQLDDAVRISSAALDLPRLVVDTTADEQDIQGTPLPGTEGERLSLREALLIANRLSAPTYAIGFDPTVFPLDSPATIQVGEQLPAITHAGVVIDGFGVGVEISGVGLPLGNGLVVRADDVWVRGITIRDFHHDHCIDVAQANRVRVSDNVFLRCHDLQVGFGTQVNFERGEDHVIVGNQFLDGGRDGVSIVNRTLGTAPSGVRILGNLFRGHGDDGITLEGRGHVVVDNEVRDNAGNGIEAGQTEDIIIVGNLFHNNGDGVLGVGSEEEHGIDLSGLSRNWQITNNELSENHSSGIHFSWSSSGIAVNRCAFRNNGATPILGSRIPPPSIESFDGTTVSGTSAAGSIEIYLVDGNVYEFADSTPSNGTWSVTLDAAATSVSATITTNDGTSEMSPVITP